MISEIVVASLLKKAKEDHIEKIVVGGLISKSNKILLLERRENDFMGGIFELPSGNLEKDETLLDGLKREVREETGLEVIEVVKLIDSFDYLSGSGKKARQFNFYVKVADGKLQLSEHSTYAWSKHGDEHYLRTTDSVKKTIQAYLNNSNIQHES